MGIVLRAGVFAEAAHAAIGQVRKYTGEPYIEHPKEVARLVMSTGWYTDEMLAAALLHDVVEDTKITLDMIKYRFGAAVAHYVDALTEREYPGLNRAQRKALEAERLGGCCREVQTIKLADLIDNAESILERDPKFAVTYLEEKRQILLVMTKGDEGLMRRAWQIVKTGQSEGGNHAGN